MQNNVAKFLYYFIIFYTLNLGTIGRKKDLKLIFAFLFYQNRFR